MAPSKMDVSTYRDSGISDIESVASSTESSDATISTPWYHRGKTQSFKSLLKIHGRRSRSFCDIGPERRARRSLWWRTCIIMFAILCFFTIIGYITYVALAASLVERLRPQRVSSGLQHIVANWREPDADGAHRFTWRNDFSRDIRPQTCHSHNDYWRSVPLYQALSFGCMGVEADIWLSENSTDLLVSHNRDSTTPTRTLRSLYLDPLTNIFENRNVSTASPNTTRTTGVFDADPNTSIILLIDFKDDGHETWPVLVSQLEPLYRRGWLTHFDGTEVIRGPLTIVGTGNTPFDLVANGLTRFIFFDAPLTDVSNPIYTSQNSYYASASLRSAIGKTWFNHLTGSQTETIKQQIKAASDKGLRSRYWDTPSWPISWRDRVWFTLTENGVGMLNVDDLYSATRWNWNWCVIAGLKLCGNS